MYATVDDRRIRIAISSDQRLFRDSLAASLRHELGLEVVGHVAEAGLSALSEVSRPDVLLFDVGLDVGASLDALDRFHRSCAEVRTIVVYDRLSVGELARARRAGANAVVSKTRALDALLLVLRRFVEPAGEVTDDDPLSEQERKVIALVAAGHTASRIAELLQVSPTAVERAKRRIYHKLGVGCQIEAVARVVGLGLLDHVREPSPRRTAAGEPLVVLRGSDSATRLAVVTTLLHAHIAVQQELLPRLIGEPWDEAQRGPVVVVLLDPDATDWLRTEDHTTPILLVHSAALRRTELADLLLHGVSAVVPADRVCDDLLPLLTVVARGYVTLETSEARALLHPQRGVGGPGLPDLTPREAEILGSIARGHTVRQTARALGIATKTVENTQARLFRKLGTNNRAGSLSVAHSLGLIEPMDEDARGAGRERPRTNRRSRERSSWSR